MNFLFFLLGCILIWQGGNLVVDSASKLARKFNISELIIGLSLVSIGTSLPEVVVSIIASLKEETAVVLGNVLGSNISNTLLIIGLTGIIKPLTIPKKRLKNEVLFYLGICSFLAANLVLSANTNLTFVSGILLIGLFIGSLVLFFKTDDEANTQEEGLKTNTESSNMITILLFLLGCIFLPLGGHMLVDSAVNIAIVLGVSKAFVSLFAVALGTSLPELVTSVIAAKKGNSQLALGNVIGSNIFNLTLVLGISSLIFPIQFNLSFIYNLAIMIGSCIPITIILFATSRHFFSKRFSIISVLLYLCYISYIYFGV